MTSSSYTPEYWPPRMYRNMPLGEWLVARIAQHEELATRLGTNEAFATEWLAAKPDLKTTKRDNYKDACITKFEITGRGYQDRVWPAARKLAGLPKRARPGPKKQIKK
jgi:hypothetical protein